MRKAYSKRKEKLVLQRKVVVVVRSVDVASLERAKQLERATQTRASDGCRYTTRGFGSRSPGKATWTGVLRQQNPPP